MAYLIRKTKRLIVRPLDLGDYQAWKTAHTTMLPAQNLWDRTNKTLDNLTMAKFKKILRSQNKMRAQEQFYDLAVFERSTGLHVGTVAVMNVQRGLAQTAYLGYFINNRFWGRGYGKESTLAAIDIAFRDIKLHRIEAGVEPSNRRSILLARSIGLRKEGLKKRVVFLRNQWNDLIIYSATCEEFGFKWKGIPQNRPR